MSNKAFRAHVKTDRANTKGRKGTTENNGSGGIPTASHTEQEQVIELMKARQQNAKRK